MAEPFFSAETLDDIMRYVIEAVLSRGGRIAPSKGYARELIGVLLEITNPRARLSRTETRGKLFSALGELCWYLAKTNRLDFIEYYIPKYAESADGEVILGGYGPRLFNWGGQDQVANVIRLLRNRPHSRRAVIQLFDLTDIVEEHKDVPCTCTLQFMIRANALHLLTSMRSNDVFLGLPHDVFCFTMLQEIVARSLSVEIGSYKHVVGSLHLYDRDAAAAHRFLEEGWQSTNTPMPVMPLGDPWPSVDALVDAESQIREKGPQTVGTLGGIDSYWADLIRLLQIFRYLRQDEPESITAVRRDMVSEVYNVFVDARLMSGPR
jgi:thymidylate synthase